MAVQISYEETYKDMDYSAGPLPAEEFEGCDFIRCNFGQHDLSGIQFLDCSFLHCNLSLAVLVKTGLKSVKFTDSKITGVDFSKCDDFLFSVSFENCQLDYCSFYQKKMKKTSFAGCSLKNADFAAADLSSCVFKNADLTEALFDGTVLEKADFRGASNYVLDPDLNNIKKARFSLSGLAGLLAKYNINIEYD